MQDMIVLLGAEVPSGRSVARKLRAEQYCCRLMTSDATAEAIGALDAAGIVIAGEEGEGAKAPDPAILSLGLPVLALGSAARLLLGTLGRRSSIHKVYETVLPVYYREAPLFEAIESGERWVEQAEYFELAEPYEHIADGDGVPVAFADIQKKIYFLQFQIERNDPDGTTMLRNFAGAICGCTPWWTDERILEGARRKIIDAVGEGEAICAMSGGLDSTVAAVLAKQAIGERAKCVFVDTGLLREDEAETTERYFSQELGLPFRRIDASARVLEALAGLEEMDKKWQVIEDEISRALRHAAREDGKQRVFIKGTNYVDVSNGAQAEPIDCGCGEVEPLGDLFKEEIRRLGEILGLSEEMLDRQPFPGMGLAARIRGEVTAERLRVLRRANAIFVEEMAESGVEKRLKRYFAMLSEVKQEGVIILRAMQGAEPNMTVARLPYDLVERTVERIGKEIPAIKRVLYDMTPGMAEWPM